MQVIQWEPVLANIMLDVWNDDTPDNNVIIDLMNGTIMRK
jgi:hypothetical protein